ncbi:MAG: hypothetical protein ACRELY_31220 [Polyangiaceae bacterium]
MMVAAVACSSSSSGTDTGVEGSSGGGDGGGGNGDGGGGGQDGGGGDSGGSSTGCTATFTSTVGASDTFTMSCSQVSANESSNITTLDINGTDPAGHTLECEYELNGDLIVKTYMSADSLSMNTSLTDNGGTAGWQQVSTAGGNARGTFAGLDITDVGTEHDLGSGKEWFNIHGTSTGTMDLFTGDAGTSTYSFTITF